MDLAANLNRTYHPKHVTYTGDGYGRDSYITTNNGGLLPGDFISPHVGYEAKKNATQLFTNQYSYRASGSPRYGYFFI